MAVFEYKVKKDHNRIEQGTIIASSKPEAGSLLKNQGLSPLYIKLASDGQKSGLFSRKGVPTIEKSNLCRYLATMIKSGLPLTEAVEVINSETENPNMKKILDEIQASLQKGQLLSSAFAKFPSVFDEVFLILVKAGEESGTLEKSFEYLGKQLYADYELKQKIKSALTYPAAITAATGAEGLGLLVFVVPKIAPVLLRLSESFPLPAYTLVILKVGLFLSHNIFFFLAGLAVIAILLGIFFTGRKGKDILTNLLSRLPVIGSFYQNLVLARFSRTLATLISSGVPITNTLQVASGTLNIPRFKIMGSLFTEEISKGISLSETLKKSGLFPPIMVGMVATGEKTASMDKLLLELANFYEEKVTNSLKAMTDLIEPMLMLAIGVAVGAVVILLIAPIYSFVGSLSQSIGGGDSPAK